MPEGNSQIVDTGFMFQYTTGNSNLRKKMTMDNLMLIYLNNTTNNKNSPNENYAREFFELFTIGKGPQIGPGDYTNYTEDDVITAAKLLTGFKSSARGTVIDPDTGLSTGRTVFNQHDTSDKTFSALSMLPPQRWQRRIMKC